MSNYPTPSQDKIAAYGLDALCDHLTGGGTLTGASKVVGVDISTLLNWVAADGQRSARVREARTAAAKIWDEKATATIESAEDAFGLAKARELAFHYRWRAAKAAPKEYGDKIEHEHKGAVTTRVISGEPLSQAAWAAKYESAE